MQALPKGPLKKISPLTDVPSIWIEHLRTLSEPVRRDFITGSISGFPEGLAPLDPNSIQVHLGCFFTETTQECLHSFKMRLKCASGGWIPTKSCVNYNNGD